MIKFVKKADYGLHQYVPNCTGCDSKGAKCNYTNCQERIYARLAEYEATGRTPEEVAELRLQFVKMRNNRDELAKEVTTLRKQLAVALKFHKTDCDDCKYSYMQQCDDHNFLCIDCPVVEACHCKDCEDGNKWVWAGGKL